MWITARGFFNSGPNGHPAPAAFIPPNASEKNPNKPVINNSKGGEPIMQDSFPIFTTAPLRPGAMHAAAQITLTALDTLGLLTDSHELLRANILGAALDIDNTPKATIAKTQLRAQIEELRRQLPEPVAAIDDAWSALEKQISELTAAAHA